MYRWNGLNGPLVIPASSNQEKEIEMKDYSKMSDFEINSAVYNFALDLGYHLTFLGEDVIEWRKDGEVITTVKVDYTKNGLRDYCNNPSDAWPIMEEHKIGLAFVNGEWRASSVIAGYHEFSDTKAFRAAMIVYLMMKDEEK